ncbi:MAG TPA: glycoside hydrolase family 3 C-terminal domain-containing protein [Anaerolineaceae bacterium]|nr:glycoside hydrolase family 3 C-terminal domain-containing protein [Anaerolineaceae bacterium]
MPEHSQNIRQTLEQLTLEEKAWLISGGRDFWHTRAIPRLGIPALTLHDGPHGLRKTIPKAGQAALEGSFPATSYPSLSAVACSFNPYLVFELGQALGAEAKAAEVDVLLAPGVNIKRHPLNGRNFEYFSEDPLVAGELASAYINGVQSQGTGVSLKHFAANNQEFCRVINNSVVDERALREIYLKPFEIAIRKAQPWTMMSSYNRLNGTYTSEHVELLTKIAREEWGFAGLFMTDWGGMNDRATAIPAGTDLEMPPVGQYGVDRILEGVRSGRIAESDLNRAIGKLLELIDKVREERKLGKTWQVADFEAIAKKVAIESAVLLKNEQSLLPLQSGMSVAVVGAMAEKPHVQGAGSSRVHPRRIVSFMDALHEEPLDWPYAQGYELSGKENAQVAQEALELCRGKDAVLFFAGLRDVEEAESYDRQHLELPAVQNALIERIASENPNVVVVLHAGSPVRMPWLGKVKAVLLMGLGGQMVGAATLELILGRANPCGKLAETWPLALEDTPAYGQFGKRFNTQYRESVFVGYRFYQSFAKAVAFPFGFGLSYTSFEIDTLEISQPSLAPGHALHVSARVTNIGSRAGREVLQLYISPPASALFRPRKELKAFSKMALAPGESRVVHFTLHHIDFAYWNAAVHAWDYEAGEYRLLLGTSVADTPLEAAVLLAGWPPEVSVPDYSQSAPGYYAYGTGALNTSDAAFESVYGSPLPLDPQGEPRVYDLNSSLWDARNRLRGRLLTALLGRAARKRAADSGEYQEVNDRIVQASILNAPLRSFAMGAPMRVPESLALILNGKIFQAIQKLSERDKT